MDAKGGDWVVTPRTGKPVEINALWHNAFRAMAAFARRLKRAPGEWEAEAGRVAAGFERFWDAAEGCCFDFLDGPSGHNAAVTAQPIIAVSLPPSPRTPHRQR